MSNEPARQPPKLIRVYDEDGLEMWVHDPEDPEFVPPDPIMMEPVVNFEVLFQVMFGLALVFFIFGPILRWIFTSLGLIGS